MNTNQDKVITLEAVKKMTDKQYNKLLEILGDEFGQIKDRFDRIDNHLNISSKEENSDD